MSNRWTLPPEPSVVVTGASSGIGRALARELARQGASLVLVARRKDRLAEVVSQISAEFGRKAIDVAGDIVHPEVRQRALSTAHRELGGLDLLINNAGVNAHGRFATASPDRLRPIMEVNFFAPVEFIRAALPLLRAGRQPMIVNVGSILGERGSPHKSEYSASKFALHGFSEAIRAELASDGIAVLVAVVGPADTEHFDHLLRGARIVEAGQQHETAETDEAVLVLPHCLQQRGNRLRPRGPADDTRGLRADAIVEVAEAGDRGPQVVGRRLRRPALLPRRNRRRHEQREEQQRSASSPWQKPRAASTQSRVSAGATLSSGNSPVSLCSPTREASSR